ncbi:Acid sphingomyelinase-like phosphodiesterase 3b [Cichlidogyrus casuarinus]|uniref:Acid sphingomyelinase-like phosphodiesterase 3b n=1 Tax=Cichlidogyrus casuarinus TaxID=1844966 RepID=A0ABD2Q508_9PLAT
MGNHDVSPANLVNPSEASQVRKNWCTKLANVWSRFFEDQEEFRRFSDNCFHAMRIMNGEKIQYKLLALNGLLWYTNNPESKPTQTLENYDPLGQFDWIESHFKDARTNNYKVILASHIPPGASENSPQVYKHMWPMANDKLLSLLIQYSDVLLTFLAAHQHTDSFRVIYKNDS